MGSASAPGSTWDSLNPPLTPWIRDVISTMGFHTMTPVQAGTIPRAMKNQDCVVEAVTGSGKTLAFVVPVLERIARREMKYSKGQIAAIIVAPTRELASQIHDVFHLFLTSLVPPPLEENLDSNPESQTDPTIANTLPEPAPYPLPMLVTSGTPTLYETFLSQSSNIIIGTPGRLASFLLSPRGQSVVRVGELDMLVLDEADRLLSAPDHRKDLEKIMRHLPKQRRTHLFSATMTDAVEELVGLGLRNPVRITVNIKDKREAQPQERRVPTALQNAFIVCRHAEKTLQLTRILLREAKVNEAAKFIIYYSTGAAVDYFYRMLSRLPELSKFHLTSLHGDLPPRVREQALSRFTTHPSSHLSPSVLLCTDVAARGVDFPDIDVVIQYDPPTDPKTFSHRAGRTARAGRGGKALVLLGKGREEEYVEFLSVRKIPLQRGRYLSSTLEEIDNPDRLDPDSISLLTQLRQIALTDRELSDKAARAFVSSVHAYTKHEAHYIFRKTDLDFAQLGIAYGLLRLPAMPEIKEWRRKLAAAAKKKPGGDEKEEVREGGGVEDENQAVVEENDIEVVPWEDAEVDWDKFAYASKQRETLRLAAIEEKRKSKEQQQQAKSTFGTSEDECVEKKGHGPGTLIERRKRKIRAEMREAWSEQKERKIRREERREKKSKRAQAEHDRKIAEGEESASMVEKFIKQGKGDKDIKSQRMKGTKASKGESEDDSEDDEADYRALKREIQEEKKASKKKMGYNLTPGKNEQDVGNSSGMFAGLD